jgi:hypothetical protein
MISTEMFDAIAKQAETTFPDCTAQQHLLKARGEIDEAIEAVKSKRLIEYIDAIHCIVAAAARDGFTAQDVDAGLYYKLAVNRVRKWTRQSDGTYQHDELEPEQT